MVAILNRIFLFCQLLQSSRVYCALTTLQARDACPSHKYFTLEVFIFSSDFVGFRPLLFSYKAKKKDCQTVRL